MSYTRIRLTGNTSQYGLVPNFGEQLGCDHFLNAFLFLQVVGENVPEDRPGLISLESSEFTNIIYNGPVCIIKDVSASFFIRLYRL